jgi:hypothetical protein
MIFYTYLWLREDGTPYYAGKGSGNRAYVSAGHVYHRPADSARILILGRASSADAFETEKELIRNWGRKDLGTGCLRNLTDGGENPPNWLGRKRGAAFSQQVGERNRGVHPSEATKAKIRAARLGTHWTQASRDKVSKTRKGVPHSPSHLAAMQGAHKDCKCPPHVRTRNLAREVQANELRG